MPLTKEELVYADTLNAFGSDLPDFNDWGGIQQSVVTNGLRRAADFSIGLARCFYCPAAYAMGGPDDGENFADMWEHVIRDHKRPPETAAYAVRFAWGLEGRPGVAA